MDLVQRTYRDLHHKVDHIEGTMLDNANQALSKMGIRVQHSNFICPVWYKTVNHQNDMPLWRIATPAQMIRYVLPHFLEDLTWNQEIMWLCLLYWSDMSQFERGLQILENDVQHLLESKKILGDMSKVNSEIDDQYSDVISAIDVHLHESQQWHMKLKTEIELIQQLHREIWIQRT